MYQGRKEKSERSVSEHYDGDEKGLPCVTVDVAVALLKVDRLPVARPTLYRWADQEKIDAVRDDKIRSWVTSEGITQARKRLEWSALSIYQREGMSKTPGGAGLPVAARAQEGSEITFH